MEKIAFDFDDVLFQTSKAFREESLRRFGFDCLENCKTYNMNLAGKVHPVTFAKFIDDVALEYWDWIQPHYYMEEVVNEICNRYGIPLIIITSRNPCLSAVTQKMIEKYIQLEYVVFFTSDKKKTCIENGVDAIIDDRFKIINECAPFVTKAIMPNRQWNVGREVKADNVYRVSTLKDILKIL